MTGSTAWRQDIYKRDRKLVKLYEKDLNFNGVYVENYPRYQVVSKKKCTW